MSLGFFSFRCDIKSFMSFSKFRTLHKWFFGLDVRLRWINSLNSDLYFEQLSLECEQDVFIWLVLISTWVVICLK